MKTQDLKPIRDGYGNALIKLGKTNPNVLVLDADLSTSTRTNWFAEKFPDRFIDVGIAEQNMVNIAAGLSLEDKIPFVTTYGVFVCGRAFDQIRNTVCYSQLNVKIVGSHGGISVGPDGGSHQAIEDIALMRILPHMTVVVPCDHFQAYKATMKIAELQGPAFLRLAREATAAITDENSDFEIGKAQIINEGDDCAVFFTGTIGAEVMKAVELLNKKNIYPVIINMHTIKPIDKEMLEEIAKTSKKIFTVEEGITTGGFGSAVLEFYEQETMTDVKVRCLALPDEFIEHGEREELLRKYHFTPDELAATIMAEL